MDILTILKDFGFPVAMCVMLIFWVKSQDSAFKKVQEDHKLEVLALIDSLNQNTLAIQQMKHDCIKRR